MAYEISVQSDTVVIRHHGDIDLRESEKAREEAAHVLSSNKLLNLIVDVRDIVFRMGFINEYVLMRSHSSVLPLGTRIALVVKPSMVTPEDVRTNETLSANYAVSFRIFDHLEAANQWLESVH